MLHLDVSYFIQNHFKYLRKIINDRYMKIIFHIISITFSKTAIFLDNLRKFEKYLCWVIYWKEQLKDIHLLIILIRMSTLVPRIFIIPTNFQIITNGVLFTYRNSMIDINTIFISLSLKAPTQRWDDQE